MTQPVDDPKPTEELVEDAKLNAWLDLRDEADVPEWADGIEIGNLVHFRAPVTDGTHAAQVVGFSAAEDYAGLPVVETPDEVAEAGADERFSVIDEEAHVPHEEVSDR